MSLTHRGGSFGVEFRLTNQSDGAAITTATITARMQDPDTELDVDWDDWTFKASGHGTLWASLPHVSGPLYKRADVNSGALVNVGAQNRNLLLWFHVVNADPPLDYDVPTPGIVSFDKPPGTAPANYPETGADLFNSLRRHVPRVLGEAIDYDGESIRAHFTAHGEVEQMIDGIYQRFYMPQITFRKADLASPPEKGDGPIVVRSQAYYIAHAPYETSRGLIKAALTTQPPT